MTPPPQPEYIITGEIIKELIDYANAEDAPACIAHILETKVRSRPYTTDQFVTDAITFACEKHDDEIRQSSREE